MSPKTRDEIKALQVEIQQQDQEIEQLLKELNVNLDAGKHPTWIWRCTNPECGELNVEGDSALNSCEICGVAKPAPAAKAVVTTKAVATTSSANVEISPRDASRAPNMPSLMASSSWKCTACTTENSPSLMQCRACFADRGEIEAALRCDACTSEITPNSKQCPVCFADVMQESPGWSCAACLSLNSELSPTCAVCYMDRVKSEDHSTILLCNACMSSVPSGVSECPVCYAEVPSGVTSLYDAQVTWACSACTSEMPESAATCLVCFNEREEGSSPALQRPGWKCGACMSLNVESDMQCSVCHADRDEDSPKGWRCEACTSLNSPMATECSVCSADAPVASIVVDVKRSTPSSVGWRCRACTTCNTESQRECSVCYADRLIVPDNANKVLTTLDICDGNREMLDGNRARELLAPGMDPLAVKKLIFKTKSFGSEASRVAAEVLKQMPNVSDVDFSDIISARQTEEALGVLKAMCEALPLDRVKILDLSDNAIGERGTRALETALRRLSNTIEILKFRNNGLSEMSIKLLVEYLGDAPKLQGIHFFSNMCGNGGAQALVPLFERQGKAPASQPFAFTMSSCRVRTDGTLALAASLKHVAHRLTFLDLNDSTMGDDGGRAMSETISMCKALQTLSLRDPALEKLSVKASMVEAICGLTKLEELDLCDADLGKKNVKNLVGQLLQTTPRIKVLRLANNSAGSAGLQALLDKSSFEYMEELDLRGNELDDAFGMKFVQTWAGRSVLKNVELSGNEFSNETYNAIRAAFGEICGTKGAEDE